MPWNALSSLLCSGIFAGVKQPSPRVEDSESSFDSLVRLLGLCSFAISLHIEYFVSWAQRVLHEFSSRSLRRQRTTGTYNWSSANTARFHLLTSRGNFVFPGFPERHCSPTGQWSSDHASVLLHFLSSLFHNKMSMPLPSVLLLFETHLIKKSIYPLPLQLPINDSKVIFHLPLKTSFLPFSRHAAQAMVLLPEPHNLLVLQAYTIMPSSLLLCLAGCLGQEWDSLLYTRLALNFLHS